MDEMSESDNKFNVTFSGKFDRSQFAVGDHAVLTMNAGRAATSSLAPEQLAELRQQIAALQAQVAAEAPADKREQALGMVDELAQATVAADEPDVSRLRRIARWFGSNAPELAGAVTSLLLGPLVGTLVGGAGGLAAALLSDDDPA
jgi:hypothetical protein